MELRRDVADISRRWWRCTCGLFGRRLHHRHANSLMLWPARTFQAVSHHHKGKGNPTWFLRRRRINIPVNFHVSFTSSSVYNARTDSETDRNVKSRDNQRISPSPKWCWLSLYQAYAWTLPSMLISRGAKSWWGCSDSDSGLLIDFDSGSDSDSESDTKCRINNTLIVERVPVSQRKKKCDISFWLRLSFLRTELLYPSYHSSLTISSGSVMASWWSPETSRGGGPVP